jgi:hypothetical protein
VQLLWWSYLAHGCCFPARYFAVSDPFMDREQHGPLDDCTGDEITLDEVERITI